MAHIPWPWRAEPCVAAIGRLPRSYKADPVTPGKTLATIPLLHLASFPLDLELTCEVPVCAVVKSRGHRRSPAP